MIIEKDERLAEESTAYCLENNKAIRFLFE